MKKPTLVMSTNRDEPAVPVSDIKEMRYDTVSKLGEGAFGVVYRARKSGDGTGSDRAMKKMSFKHSGEGLTTPFMRETAALIRLQRLGALVPNVHEVFLGEEKGAIVFDLADCSLKEKIDINNATRDDYTWSEAYDNVLSYTFDLLYTMAIAHSVNVFHRDLKPQNLLLKRRDDGSTGDGNRTERLWVADWGLTRLSCGFPRTDTHEICTVWYRPPEVMLGATQYDLSVDVWSMGCVISEMLTGRPLWRGDGSEIDQLFRIFRTLGTPTEDTWPGVTKLRDYQVHFPKWPGKTGEDLEDELAGDARSFVPLLRRMLAYDPTKRITAVEALRLPMFAGLLSKELADNPGSWFATHCMAGEDGSQGQDHDGPTTCAVTTPTSPGFSTPMKQIRVRQRFDSPLGGSVANHPDLNAKMLSILKDWLHDVYEKYRLRPETYQGTLRLIDDFLARCGTEGTPGIGREKLQLVGITAMFIFAKFEEIFPPECNDFVYVAANAYTRDEILAMERRMLCTVDWSVFYRTKTIDVVRIFSRELGFDVKNHSAIKYFATLAEAMSDGDDGMRRLSSTELAVGAAVAAMTTMKNADTERLLRDKMEKIGAVEVTVGEETKTTKEETKEVVPDLTQIAGMSYQRISELGQMMLRFHGDKRESTLQSVQRLYSSRKMCEVAKLADQLASVN